MQVRDKRPVHLTYCLNIHPGDTWDENLSAIRNNAAKVRDAVSGGKPFGLGLRLSNTAARSLVKPRTLKRFKDFLAEANMYVFTINGFPYGRFHGKQVKEEVYKPDWRTNKRLDYTILLADLLTELLPEGVPGSISTVPCSYKEWIKRESDVKEMAENLIRCAAHLHGIRAKTGKDICLALEPEPDCVLETTAEVIRFFKSYLQPSEITRHLGVCFDACHLAVQFEDPIISLKLLREAGIQISKIQLSAALKGRVTDSVLRSLMRFCDPVYLHQVRIRDRRGGVKRHDDLSPELLIELGNCRNTELRAHFHVPLYFTRYGDLQSTASELNRKFFETVLNAGIPHLEIETYTFDVLPPKLRSLSVTESIVREYRWVKRRINNE